MRSFLAVEVPLEIRHELDRVIAAFRSRSMPVRWVAVENQHLTVKFLGEIDDAQSAEVCARLEPIAARTPKFHANLKGIGAFPNTKAPRVIWAGVEMGGPELVALSRKVEDALVGLGLEPKERFHPHLTIGRVKGRIPDEGLFGVSYVSVSFTVDCIVLFKSTLTPKGAVYTRLADFALVG